MREAIRRDRKECFAENAPVSHFGFPSAIDSFHDSNDVPAAPENRTQRPAPCNPGPRLQRRITNPFSSAKFKLPVKERISPNYSRKISDILMEFAQEIAPAESAADIFSDGLAVRLWNAPLLPAQEQTKSIDCIRAWLVERGRLDWQAEIERLLELRQNLHASDRRMVMDFKLEYVAKDPRLSVVSLDKERPENRDLHP